MAIKLQTLVICPFNSLPKVYELWKQVARNSQVTFFNDWPWVSCWLNSLPESIDIKFIVNLENDVPISCFFVGMRKNVENKFKKVRGYINNTGKEEFDDLVVEYNTLLCSSTNSNQHLLKVFDAIPKLEEIRLTHNHNLTFSRLTDFHIRTTQSPSYWVDLLVVNTASSYRKQLSANTRRQLNQSLNYYNKMYGEITIDIAKTLDVALCYLDNLKKLHQKYWKVKDKDGAFSTSYFCNFHENFIRENFANNSIQLIKVCAGKTDIGYLYNFIYQGEVLFYQSGFNYLNDNKCRPGLIAHMKAIEKCAELELKKYNFLVGDTRYKKSLSTHSDLLKSFTISKKSLKSYTEVILRKINSIKS